MSDILTPEHRGYALEIHQEIVDHGFTAMMFVEMGQCYSLVQMPKPAIYDEVAKGAIENILGRAHTPHLKHRHRGPIIPLSQLDRRTLKVVQKKLVEIQQEALQFDGQKIAHEFSSLLGVRIAPPEGIVVQSVTSTHFYTDSPLNVRPARAAAVSANERMEKAGVPLNFVAEKSLLSHTLKLNFLPDTYSTKLEKLRQNPVNISDILDKARQTSLDEDREERARFQKIQEEKASRPVARAVKKLKDFFL